MPRKECGPRPSAGRRNGKAADLYAVSMRRNLIWAIVVLAFVAGATACGGSSKSGNASSTPTTPTNDPCSGPATPAPPKSTLPTATIETNCGTIVVALDTKKAPKAAGRFLDLAQSGFYNGKTFHRVVPDFVIQGGDPKGDGTGGTGTSVVGETPKDGYPIGSLAAAKTGNDPPGTFDCQFFIVTGEQGTSLPPDYARFGKVIAGMDVAKRIEKLAPPEGDGPPTEKVTMTKVTITQP